MHLLFAWRREEAVGSRFIPASSLLHFSPILLLHIRSYSRPPCSAGVLAAPSGYQSTNLSYAYAQVLGCANLRHNRQWNSGSSHSLLVSHTVAKQKARVELHADELIFCNEDGKEISASLLRLRRVIQVVWGSELFGMSPDSIWLFDFGEEAIRIPPITHGWYKLLPQLIEQGRIPKKLEIWESLPPKCFAKVPRFCHWLPITWKFEMSMVEPKILEQFLQAHNALEVPEFTVYL